MSALVTLRDRLMRNTELQQFWFKHYGREARHFIGYKHSPSANDYPSVCYVPVRSRLGIDSDDNHLISLVVGVHETGVTDGVFDGFSKTEEAQRIITAFLMRYSANGSWVNGEITVQTDLGIHHPFYEIEIQFNLITAR
jgi:hypothetical protein